MSHLFKWKHPFGQNICYFRGNILLINSVYTLINSVPSTFKENRELSGNTFFNQYLKNFENFLIIFVQNSFFFGFICNLRLKT